MCARERSEDGQGMGRRVSGCGELESMGVGGGFRSERENGLLKTQAPKFKKIFRLRPK